jgi:hypothetical protein
VKAAAAAVALIVVGGLVACGDAEKANPDASNVAATPGSEKVVARSARLSAGARPRLLTVPGVGRLRVKCDADGATATTFVTGDKTATMDVVVDSAGQTVDTVLNPGERFSPRASGLKVGLEHWQFAEFAKAQAVVATIEVAIRAVDEDYSRCAVSAKASVFSSVLGTLTK